MTLVVGARLTGEPDGLSRGFAIAPRVLVRGEVLERSGLLAPGGLTSRTVRVALSPNQDPRAVGKAVQASLPDSRMRVRDRLDAAPGARRLIDQLEYFLGFIGLASLVAGGLGVAGAVSAYLSAREPAIAVLKALGAQSGLIRDLHLIQIAVLALLGIAIGLVVGGAAPLILGQLAGSSLPVAGAVQGLSPAPGQGRALWPAGCGGVLVAAPGASADNAAVGPVPARPQRSASVRRRDGRRGAGRPGPCRAGGRHGADADGRRDHDRRRGGVVWPPRRAGPVRGLGGRQGAGPHPRPRQAGPRQPRRASLGGANGQPGDRSGRCAPGVRGADPVGAAGPGQRRGSPHRAGHGVHRDSGRPGRDLRRDGSLGHGAADRGRLSAHAVRHGSHHRGEGQADRSEERQALGAMGVRQRHQPVDPGQGTEEQPASSPGVGGRKTTPVRPS